MFLDAGRQVTKPPAGVFFLAPALLPSSSTRACAHTFIYYYIFKFRGAQLSFVVQEFRSFWSTDISSADSSTCGFTGHQGIV